MNWLTKHEQLVIGIVAALLLTGLIVKHSRAVKSVIPKPDVESSAVAKVQPVNP